MLPKCYSNNIVQIIKMLTHNKKQQKQKKEKTKTIIYSITVNRESSEPAPQTILNAQPTTAQPTHVDGFKT